MNIDNYVLCLNCEEMVAISDVETHSKACVQVAPEVQSSSLQQTHSALRKFVRFLETVPAGRQEACFLDLLSLAQRFLLLTRPEAAKSLSAEVTQLEHRCQFFLQYSVRRLMTLSHDLIFHLERKTRNGSNGAVTRQIEMYRHQTDLYREHLCGNDPVTKIMRKGEERSLSEGQSLDASMEASEETLNEAATDSLRKYFYVKCYGLQLSTKKSRRLRAEAVESLYQEAMNRGISVEDWQEFIKSHLHGRGSLFRYQPTASIDEENE